jgi:large subunit ribosomal protein L18
MAFSKESRRNKIRRRVRADISGTPEMPRLAVFRSNKEIYVQVIDDLSGKTLAAASSKDIKGTKIEQAGAVGKSIAEKSIAAGISKVIFDRGGYLYHGRVKALADGARESGLKF